MRGMADTHTAALYVLMHDHPEQDIQLFRKGEVQRAKRRIYNWARDGKLTRHGGPTKGSAQWDLREIHRMCTHPG